MYNITVFSQQQVGRIHFNEEVVGGAFPRRKWRRTYLWERGQAGDF